MVHTHELVFADSRLVKRYTSWDRGEHRREWAVLRRVHRHAPDLVPRPIAADLTSRPPSITMSVIPGTPLTDVLTYSQSSGVVALWDVPHDGIDGVAPWTADLAG